MLSNFVLMACITIHLYKYFLKWLVSLSVCVICSLNVVVYLGRREYPMLRIGVV